MTLSRFRPLLGCLTLLLAAPLAGPLPAQAQITQEQAYQRGRAANLARMRAEALNGGLGVYRAAACMYQLSGGPCLVGSAPNGLLFRFYGGPPGAEQQGKPPTLETEILISPDGRQVVEVLYNGPPRSSATPAGS
ncbi:hypothetical protein [Synechococcus sp. CCY 9618]|uniref:hypothetical protein n=1 Tax=Synechococcus sp. CCY 9618 TaxID=2815602 RepID=UPI001C233744|nr:hypothetical protein [Synechococcus sp. CCY 9618]